MVNLYIGDFSQDEDKLFFDLKAQLSNTMEYKRSFWNYAIIPVMTIEQLKKWSGQKSININLMVGSYEGEGSKWDRQNMLTTIDDFNSLSFSKTTHSIAMQELLETGCFSDVTILCKDDTELYGHRCILIAPYFKALLSGNL